MMRIILVLIMIFSNLRGSEMDALVINTLDYFSDQEIEVRGKDDLKNFILNLRSKIIQLGYSVPPLKDMILQIDLSGNQDVLQELMLMFNLNQEFNVSYGLCCNGSIDNELEGSNLVNAYIGGVEMLAGALLMIIPFGPTRIAALLLLEDGFSRVLDDVVEKAKQNEKNYFQEIKSLIYD